MSMVVEAVQECGSKHGRVGAELGPESRLTMPVGDFLRVKEALSPAEMVDGDWLLRRMRMVKSAAEIALIRFVCQAVSQAFEDLPNKLRAGDTERVAARKFQADVLHNGGEKIIYLICTSGPERISEHQHGAHGPRVGKRRRPHHRYGRLLRGLLLRFRPGILLRSAVRPDQTRLRRRLAGDGGRHQGRPAREPYPGYLAGTGRGHCRVR